MMLRSFIAIEIPAHIQQKIAGFTFELTQSLPRPLVRWVAPQNIHLTLQFLGDVPEADLGKLATALAGIVLAPSRMEVIVTNFGAFPSPNRARVLWIGLNAPPELAALHRRVAEVTTRLGFRTENRFSPHLTIGRVNRNANDGDLARIFSVVKNTNISELGRFFVDGINIYKSDLLPSGSVYTRLYSVPLKYHG